MKNVDARKVELGVLDKLDDQWHVVLVEAKFVQLRVSLLEGQIRGGQGDKPVFNFFFDRHKPEVCGRKIDFHQGNEKKMAASRHFLFISLVKVYFAPAHFWLMTIEEKVENWFVPLSTTDLTLKQAHSQLDEFGLDQDDVPLIIQLVENPKFDLPGIDIFHGATNLETHDYIHILLGRGVMIKDEAFVLGFTMGSSNRVTTTEERLFSFMTKYVYPKDYRFTDEDLHIFKDAVRLGFVSDCQSLAKVDYKKYLDWPLQKIREDIGIEVDLLKAYYAIEARRYPHIKECNRNLVGF